ncbi:MAG: hypothetical protein NZZ41_02730 [Candidatus Dojkabacteria bacterium]|nr:hypothetical protein [Candidatus Dojkabacteria bacterium]
MMSIIARTTKTPINTISVGNHRMFSAIVAPNTWMVVIVVFIVYS